MADLIIKPSSGNSLVLQDEGGDAALTVGTTGSTTLAGTANNLGTATAGTLSSGVTFPTGHVLQVQSHIYLTNSSLTDGAVDILTKTFNRIKGNSHFIVWYVLSMAPIQDQADMDGVNPRIQLHVNDSPVDQGGHLVGDGLYYSDVPAWRTGGTHNGRYDIFQVTGSADVTNISSGSAGDSVTITIELDAHTGGLYINRAQATAASGATSSLVIWEVQ